MLDPVMAIGFNQGGTYTPSPKAVGANIPTESLPTIVHPQAVKQDIVADRYVFDNVFGGRSYRFPGLLLNLPRRVVGLVYRKLKKATCK